MCANHGHIALLLNFFCSLRAAKIPTPKHFIVTTDPDTASLLTSMGLTAFYHVGLGEFPTKASEGCVSMRTVLSLCQTVPVRGERGVDVAVAAAVAVAVDVATISLLLCVP
jgi:hypothetical protein